MIVIVWGMILVSCEFSTLDPLPVNLMLQPQKSSLSKREENINPNIASMLRLHDNSIGLVGLFLCINLVFSPTTYLHATTYLLHLTSCLSLRKHSSKQNPAEDNCTKPLVGYKFLVAISTGGKISGSNLPS